ncbi:purine-binding chemotaxis protein CheW [bacterium]|nr:purine-binding chemotaxis protein CheW [bacterium]
MSRIGIVTFSLGNEKYGVDILKVKEVMKVPDITPVPGTPSFILGVINLRGDIIPVIDLNIRLGFPRPLIKESAIILILNIEDYYIGIIVEALPVVIYTDMDQINRTPTMIQPEIDLDLVEGVVEIDDQNIIMMNIDKLLLERNIMEMRAQHG